MLKSHFLSRKGQGDRHIKILLVMLVSLLTTLVDQIEKASKIHFNSIESWSNAPINHATLCLLAPNLVLQTEHPFFSSQFLPPILLLLNPLLRFYSSIDAHQRVRTMVLPDGNFSEA